MIWKRLFKPLEPNPHSDYQMQTSRNPEQWLDRFLLNNDILLVEVQARTKQQMVRCKILKQYSNIYSLKTNIIEFVYTAGTWGYPALEPKQIALVAIKPLAGGLFYESFHPRHFRVVLINGQQKAIWYGKISSEDTYFPAEIRQAAMPWLEQENFTMLPFELLEEFIMQRLRFLDQT